MGRPLRVLHVVVNLNRGGAETLLMNLYRHIDRSKIQFDFLTCRPGVFDKEVEELGGKIHQIPYVTDGGHFKFINKLRSFFYENQDYQIIHSHLDKMSGLVLREAKQAGISIRIAHSHNTNSEGNFIVKWYKWYSGTLIKENASHYFACSQKAAIWLFGKAEKKVILLKNGINLRGFSYSEDNRKKVRQELGLNDDQFVIGHIGRFNKQKNHSFVVDIFSEVLKRNPNSILLLVGDGELRKKSESKVKQLGIQSSVRFLGIRGDVDQVIHSFDLFLFPSYHEGFPVTLVEAQAAGVPCLISNVITTEVDLGIDLIRVEKLESSCQKWAKKAISLKSSTRANVLSKLKNTGFDVKESSDWLGDFYLKEWITIHSRDRAQKGVLGW